MTDEQYIEPKRRTQIIVFLVIIFGALLFVSLNPIIRYITPSPRLMTTLTLGINVISLIISLLGVRYFGRQGYRTLKLGSYPPFGSIVAWRTKILTGRQAILMGYLSITIAVFMAFFTLIIGYTTWLFT